MVFFKVNGLFFNVSGIEFEKMIVYLEDLEKYQEENVGGVFKSSWCKGLKRRTGYLLSETIFWFLCYLSYIHVGRRFYTNKHGFTRIGYIIKLNPRKKSPELRVLQKNIADKKEKEHSDEDDEKEET